MRVNKANFSLFGAMALGLLALNGCKAEASAHIGGGEPQTPAPTPTEAAAPAPAPKPIAAPQKRLVAVGKVKLNGDKVQLPGEIEFEYNKSDIKQTPQNTDILNQLQQFMQQNPNVTMLRIEGHTDDKGDAKYNKDLSEKRAEAVAAYLTTKGIDKGRIKTVGFGADKPEVPNTSDENRARNRRTEFHVEEIDGKPAQNVQ
jgi:outer membrane protein OmpA-like peptidoglycan-associated protein